MREQPRAGISNALDMIALIIYWGFNIVMGLLISPIVIVCLPVLLIYWAIDRTKSRKGVQ